MIIRPENPKCRTVARIKIESDKVSVLFAEKRDDFIKLVKSLGYSWDYQVWYKRSAKAIDCAAELGYSLISAGFWIEIPTEEIANLIIEESFEKEPKRKVLVITKGIHEGWFALVWPYENKIYDAAMKIAGSKYSKPYVLVPPESYEEVLDFAHMHDFYISPAAQKVINESKEMFDNALILSIVEKQKKTGLPVPTGLIDDELADKD